MNINDTDNLYKEKYLKYKFKYLELKELYGGKPDLPKLGNYEECIDCDYFSVSISNDTTYSHIMRIGNKYIWINSLIIITKIERSTGDNNYYFMGLQL